jgi:glycosyltransferase involved in cell wall biosynthesis
MPPISFCSFWLILDFIFSTIHRGLYSAISYTHFVFPLMVVRGKESENNVIISIVVPVYNESGNLNELTSRLRNVLSQVGMDWEVLFIDDGSVDNSWEIIRQINQEDSRIRGIRLSRNFGQQAALTAGFQLASGEVVIPMDADLQDPSELIPMMLQKWQEGYQVVYAIRQGRKEGWFRNWSAGVFYRLLNRVADIKVALDSGDFCLLDRQVVEAINQLPEYRRFQRGLRSWVGFKQIGIPFDRDARFQGKSKYRLRDLLELALDGFFCMSKAPFRLVLYLGLIIVILGSLGFIGVVIMKTSSGISLIGTLSIMAVICIIGGIILVSLGIVGEYLHRIFEEVRKRPIYIIQEKLLESTNQD